jgi:hypothetical protein
LFVSNCNQQSQLAPITIQRPKHDENKNCAVNSGRGSYRAAPVIVSPLTCAARQEPRPPTRIARRDCSFTIKCQSSANLGVRWLDTALAPIARHLTSRPCQPGRGCVMQLHAEPHFASYPRHIQIRVSASVCSNTLPSQCRVSLLNT